MNFYTVIPNRNDCVGLLKTEFINTADTKTQQSYLQFANREENQALAGAIPFCDEHPGSRFEDNFRTVNQIDGILKAGGDKMAAI